MRSFREFEKHRLTKFVTNAREPDEDLRKIDSHHHKLVVSYIGNFLLPIKFRIYKIIFDSI